MCFLIFYVRNFLTCNSHGHKHVSGWNFHDTENPRRLVWWRLFFHISTLGPRPKEGRKRILNRSNLLRESPQRLEEHFLTLVGPMLQRFGPFLTFCRRPLNLTNFALGPKWPKTVRNGAKSARQGSESASRVAGATRGVVLNGLGTPLLTLFRPSSEACTIRRAFSSGRAKCTPKPCFDRFWPGSGGPVCDGSGCCNSWRLWHTMGTSEGPALLGTSRRGVGCLGPKWVTRNFARNRPPRARIPTTIGATRAFRRPGPEFGHITLQ